MSGDGVRLLPRSDYLRIKAAIRALIDAAGGGLAAAGLGLRVGKSNLSDYGSIHRLEIFMPADVIADLEASVEEPIVTRALARLQGYELYKLPESKAGEDWVGMLGESAKDTGNVIARLGAALSDDGKVTAHEVRESDLVPLIDEALRELVRLRVAALAAPEGGRRK